MGPRLFRRGNLIRVFPLGSLRELQWGHVFSDVEIMVEGVTLDLDRGASMGPRLFRRGNTGSGSTGCWAGNGFNGATSFQTWKYQMTHSELSERRELQWGHVFSDVEMVASAVLHLLDSQLQWGHVFSDVEMLAPANPWRRPAACFNGATSFQTWK